jgi:glutamate/tyrosine decarboxylase-like PLP-dependent enzyme
MLRPRLRGRVHAVPASRPALSDEELPAAIADLVAEHLRRDLDQPMRPHRTPEQLERDLAIAIDGGASSWPVVRALLGRVLEVTPSTSSRRFFNQLFGGRDPLAVVGEVAAVLANSPMHTFKVSGVQVLIERAVLRRMAHKAGMAGGDGMFAPGGSMSNLAALVMARNHALPEVREHGRWTTPLAVYASQEVHYSLRKACGMLGLGRDALRLIPADATGRLRPELLEQAIVDDVARGTKPAMILATAGTTVLGAFDPLEACAEIAERHGVWLHVDAAYGGSALMSSQHRGLLAGCERADSLTWDAHKLLSVPLVCSALLTRRAGTTTAAFDETASYLFQGDPSLDPGRGSLQCGRRNDALKLWLAWKHHGDDGLANNVDHLFALASHLAARIAAAPGMRLVMRPASVNVCFEVEGVPASLLCRTLWQREIAQIGHAVHDGREIVRWVLVDPRLGFDELDAVLDDVRATAASLRGG